MNIEDFATHCELFETYAERVKSTAFENWHPAAVAAAVNAPYESIRIPAEILSDILSSNPNYRQHFDEKRPKSSVELDHDVNIMGGRTYFPKIGPISWKEYPMLCEIPDKDLNMYLERLTRSITDRMAIILSAFSMSDTDTYLHLFPYEDFSNYFEVRFIVVEGRLISGRWINVPEGADVNADFSRAMSKYAAALVSTCQFGTVQIDLCAPADQDQNSIKLLEINPFFTENERR